MRFLPAVFTLFAATFLTAPLVALLGCNASAPMTVSAPTPAVAALAGSWANDRGSLLVLSAPQADGRFTGTFSSAVGNVEPSKAFVVAGVANGDVIAFTVSFGSAGSAAAWVGQLTRRDGTDALVTQWHLARDVPDAEEDKALWSSVLTGSDVFVRR